jgi:long-chain acyl-CoA synthetase
MGLKPNDKVAIIGENEPQWYGAEFAIQAARAIPIGLHPFAPSNECKHLLSHYGVNFIFAGDQEQVDKMVEIKDELPQLERIIYWDSKGLGDYNMPYLLSYEELQRRGREYEQSHPSAFEGMIEETKGNDIAFIVPPSATTASEEEVAREEDDKWTYDRAIKSIGSFLEATELAEDYRYVPVMPPAGTGGQLFDVGAFLMAGFESNFPEGVERDIIFRDSREIGPQVWGGNKALWDAMISQIQPKISEIGGGARFTYNLCLPASYKIAELELAPRKPNPFWKAVRAFTYLILFRPLLDKLGLLRVKVALCPKDSLDPDILRYFCALGLPIRQAYSLSEAGLLQSEIVGRN